MEERIRNIIRIVEEFGRTYMLELEMSRNLQFRQKT